MKHGPEKGVFQGQNGCYGESVDLSLPDYPVDLDGAGGVIHNKIKVSRINVSTEDNCDMVSQGLANSLLDGANFAR